MSLIKYDKDQIFTGWPKTVCDREKRTVTIKASYMSPEGEGWKDALMGLTMTAGLFWGLANGSKLGLKWYHFVEGGILIYVINLLVAFLIFRSRVWVVFSEDQMRIRTFWSGWKSYRRVRGSGYGFQHMPHQKQTEEMRKAKPNQTLYYRDAYQIYMNHYQGFVLFPGISGWEKTFQFYNRLLGVEMWVHEAMPREWGTEGYVQPEVKDLEKPKKKWIKNFFKFLSKPLFFLFGFIGFGASLLTVLVAVLFLIDLTLGPDISVPFFQFLRTREDWVYTVLLGFYFIWCFEAGLRYKRKLEERLYGIKDPSSEENIIDAEFTDIPSEAEAQEEKNGFGKVLLSILMAFFLSLTWFIASGYFFEAAPEEIRETFKAIPDILRPFVMIGIGLLLIHILKRSAEIIKHSFAGK